MTEPEDRVDLMAPPAPEAPRNSADLLACASDGDATAWEELIRRYKGLVRSTVASFQLQEADAQDAVQNTWLRLAERMDTIRDPERLGGWLTTTAIRECLTLIQHRTVAPPTASKQLATTEMEPDTTVIAGQASTAHTARRELTRRREMLIQHLFYEVDRATDMPQGSTGPTRRRLLQEPEYTLEQRGFVSQAGTDVVEDVNWISREPTEGDRTGSHLLDDLLDQANQALREKLEPKVTDIRTGSTQGTGDAQLDDLLQRADTALRTALHEQGTTVSSYLPAEKNDRGDGRIALLPTDRSQEGTRSRAQLTEQEWADLFRQGRRRRLPAGTLLFLEGSRSDKVEVVISGQVKVFTTAEDGTEVFLAVRGPGDLLGEFAAIDGQPHSASVKAMEPVKVLTIKVPDFTAFLQTHPRTMWLLLRILTTRLRDADRKQIEFGVYDTLTRVSCRLVELAERFGEPTESGARIALRLTQEELASWVGASREAVVKALQTLRARSYVRTERRTITVLDLEGLRVIGHVRRQSDDAGAFWAGCLGSYA